MSYGVCSKFARMDVKYLSNPDLVRWILDTMGERDAKLAFEDEARRAHDERAKTFRMPGMHMDI